MLTWLCFHCSLRQNTEGRCTRNAKGLAATWGARERQEQKGRGCRSIGWDAIMSIAYPLAFPNEVERPIKANRATRLDQTKETAMRSHHNASGRSFLVGLVVNRGYHFRSASFGVRATYTAVHGKLSGTQLRAFRDATSGPEQLRL